MALLLILEDNPRDLGVATDIALKAGFSDVLAHSCSSMAEVILGNAIEDGKSLPDAMILDLDLGLDGSGFELLRFCHKNRLFPRIHVIVWTVKEEQREVCHLFGVQEFVGKREGPDALYDALVKINPPRNRTAA